MRAVSMSSIIIGNPVFTVGGTPLETSFSGGTSAPESAGGTESADDKWYEEPEDIDALELPSGP